jgi:large subunit ribosomal protein L4
MAAVSKLQDDQVVVIDDLSFDAPCTKDMAGLLKSLGLDGVSTLVSTADHDANVYKSARNLQRVDVSTVADWNALALLSPRRILVTKAALDAFKEQAAG